MKQNLVKGKVDYCIFDRSFENSTCLYARHKYSDPSMLAEVNSNRKAVAAVFNRQDIITAKQVHGNEVLIFRNDQKLGQGAEQSITTESEADAIVTNISGLVIAVQTADCTPVLLASSCGEVIAAVHCGWRSARADILKNTIDKMNEILSEDIDNSNRNYSNSYSYADDRAKNQNQPISSEIIAFIGPCIRQESYEVDHNFFNDFMEESASNSCFFEKQEKLEDNGISKYRFDLPGYVDSKLRESGVRKIEASGDDTYVDSLKYPSRRRSFHEGKEYRGNILSTICIR